MRNYVLLRNMLFGLLIFGIGAQAQAEEGKLGQASLDLDTADCPTTFGPPTCQEQTTWSLAKTTVIDTIDDPDNEPFAFTVTVTEGPTTTIISGGGQIVVTNSGELSAVLSSIVVNLELTSPLGGNAPGPSGGNWLVLGTAIASETGACGALARTCYGELTATPGASLVLIDPDNNDIIALSGVLPIPPTIDNDGDGLRDEDPADGIDNDGDGQIDEDGACTEAVIINFEYEFDVSGMGLVAGWPLRINLMATFGGAGRRGNSPSFVSCTIDANCNGVIDVDDPSTPLVDESEDDNVRTIQQRHGFPMPECERTCDTVSLTDIGAVSDDPGCVSVTNGTMLDEIIAATGIEGTQTVRNVTGDVSCLGGDCSTMITNTAVLTCDDDSLISGSPAMASFAVTCMGSDPRIEVGDFCTQTQGGWGTPAFGNNAGTLLMENFLDFWEDPPWLVIGDLGGPGGGSPFSLRLSRHWRVANFLPQGGPPSSLTADLTDPVTSSAGVFAGQLVAATINVTFDAADPQIRKDGTPGFAPGTLGQLTYVEGCVDAALVGKTVNEVIAWSNEAIGGVALGAIAGLPAGVTIADLNNALSVLNENFADCDTNLGCLELPPGFDPSSSPPPPATGILGGGAKPPPPARDTIIRGILRGGRQAQPDVGGSDGAVLRPRRR